MLHSSVLPGTSTHRAMQEDGRIPEMTEISQLSTCEPSQRRLTVRQRGKLARVADVNRHLYKAYLLKEELRLVFKLKGPRAVALLDAWLVWARRCRIPAFVKLARSITDHRAGIQASLLYGLSNGLVESINTKLRLLTRIAFGYHSPDALISLAMLALGGLCPPLPSRA